MSKFKFILLPILIFNALLCSQHLNAQSNSPFSLKYGNRDTRRKVRESDTTKLNAKIDTIQSKMKSKSYANDRKTKKAIAFLVCLKEKLNMAKFAYDTFDIQCKKNGHLGDIYSQLSKKYFDELHSLNPNVDSPVDRYLSRWKILYDSATECSALFDSVKNLCNVIMTKKYLSETGFIWPLFMIPKNHDIPTVMNSIYGTKQFDFFQNLSSQIGASTFINSELANALFGKFRLGLSASLKATGDTSKDNIQTANFQKLLSSGASFKLSIQTPVFNYTSIDNNFHAGLYLDANIGLSPIDTSGFVKTFNQFNFISNEGAILHFDAFGSSISDGLRNAMIYAEFPISYYWGSKTYLNSLSVPDFSVIQFNGGIVFKGSLAIKFSGPLLSTSKAVQKTPWTISIQTSPSSLF